VSDSFIEIAYVEKLEAKNKALQAQLDKVKSLIADHRDAFAPDHPPHDLHEFMRELEAILKQGVGQ